MREPITIRRFETIFWGGMATLYVVRRLLAEIADINDQVVKAQNSGVLNSTLLQDLASYDHTLNNNVPLLAGMGLLLVAWYLAHQLAYPQLQKNPTSPTGWLQMGVSLLILFVSICLYHYLKLYVRDRYDEDGHLLGLKVYSLYRKRTVLSETLGFVILFGIYEVAFQAYWYIVRIWEHKYELLRLWLNYLLLGVITLVVGQVALWGRLPKRIWQPQGPLSSLVFVAGFLLLLQLLQLYSFRFLLQVWKTELPRRRAINVAVYMALAILGTCGLLTVYFTNIYEESFGWYTLGGLVYHFLIRSILPALVLAIAGLGLAYARQQLRSEKNVLQTQVSTKAAELASLRAQINPHFLFNALNSLYATALKENSEKTADGIQKLGDMMRFMLQENNRDRIPLSKEIAYLHNYIELQRMRLDESHGIDIRVTIQASEREIYLAPMLLIPFVENAFKHGISLRNPSWIYITLTLDATQLYFKVHNSLHARHANDPEAEGSGIGLANVQKRLDLLYPDRHQLTIQASEQDYFVSLLLAYW